VQPDPASLPETPWTDQTKNDLQAPRARAGWGSTESSEGPSLVWATAWPFTFESAGSTNLFKSPDATQGNLRETLKESRSPMCHDPE